MEPARARPTDPTAHLAPTETEQAHQPESEALSSSLLAGESPGLCAGIRANGQRCRARASTGHDFCPFHRSDLQGAFHAGRVRGGLHRRIGLAELEEEAAARLSLGLDSRGGIQAGLENLLRLALLGKVSPGYIAAVTRIYATAIRNIERTTVGSEDQTFSEYTAGLAANHRLHAEAQRRDRAAAASAARARQEMEQTILSLLAEQPPTDIA